MDFNKIEDDKLVESYFAGDEESLSILIKKYLNPIYFFIYGYLKNIQDSEDVVSDTFLKLYKNIKKFNKDKKFKTWIFEIAKNTALDYLKKKKNITFSELEKYEDFNFEESIEDESALQNEIFENNINSNILKNKIDKLDFKYREVLILYYFSELNFREISELLNESINTVKSKYRRALIILKQYLYEN